MSDESAAQAAQLQSNLIQDGEDSVEAANGEGGGAGTEGTVRSQHFLLTVIDNLSEYFGVEHTQVYVGICLIVLIWTNLFLISVAWKRYSLTIGRFFAEEKNEKIKEENDSEEAKKQD